MEKETIHADFGNDFWNCFDHSYGCLCDGSLYYWENRWGGKTFVKASVDGFMEFGIACSNNSQAAIIPFPDAGTLNDEWEKDHKPRFYSPTNEDLIALISGLVESFATTSFFVEKYLTPGKVLTAQDSEKFDEFYYGSRAVPNDAKNRIRNMKYRDFLRTPYWKEISKRVKRARGSRCQLCGAKDHLELHHSEYSIRGEEISNKDKLIVLCHGCHAKFHDKDK